MSTWIRREVERCFELLVAVLADLEAAWTAEPERALLRRSSDALKLRVRSSLRHLVGIADALPSQRMAARAGYLCVLGFAQLLERAAEQRWADGDVLDEARLAVFELLEAWRPCVTVAEAAIAAVVLDRQAIERACEAARVEAVRWCDAHGTGG